MGFEWGGTDARHRREHPVLRRFGAWLWSLPLEWMLLAAIIVFEVWHWSRVLK